MENQLHGKLAVHLVDDYTLFGQRWHWIFDACVRYNNAAFIEKKNTDQSDSISNLCSFTSNKTNWDTNDVVERIFEGMNIWKCGQGNKNACHKTGVLSILVGLKIWKSLKNPTFWHN